MLMALISIPEINRIKNINRQDIIIVVALGCVLNGIGYITWTRANRVAREKGISISSVASIMFILPILSLIIIAVLLGETILAQTYFLVSLLLVFLSTILCQRAFAFAKAMGKHVARVG
jgi:drug/metabolite transporter (DMT)-like permease